MKSSSKSMPSASCWLSKWVGKRLQFLKRFCSALPSCWESGAATGGVHPASWTLQRGSTLAWIWNRMSSREFEKVVFVQFIMAQLLQKEEVSGVRQNPKTVPTETLPLLICFRKECSQGRRSAVCWALSASPSGGPLPVCTCTCSSPSLRLAQVVLPEPPQNSCSSLPQLSFLLYLLLMSTFGNKRSPCIISVYSPPIHSAVPPLQSDLCLDLPGYQWPAEFKVTDSFLWSQQQSHCWPCLLPEMFSPLDFGCLDFLPTSSSITLSFHKESFSLTHILHVSIAQNFGLKFWSSYFVCSHI